MPAACDSLPLPALPKKQASQAPAARMLPAPLTRCAQQPAAPSQLGRAPGLAVMGSLLLGSQLDAADSIACASHVVPWLSSLSCSGYRGVVLSRTRAGAAQRVPSGGTCHCEPRSVYPLRLRPASHAQPRTARNRGCTQPQGRSLPGILSSAPRTLIPSSSQRCAPPHAVRRGRVSANT